ncbi:hypothetical protein K7I13_07310 [Brucepastera parasyntrophica]|uniref:hypothetical protein n=1 Tax=Brucepastera parasyntrophica TaxID=2880008 RepID=UPI00210AD0BF|nr:hypothetical protein [Brucepastera parasyntrophica]ULQ61051.1 hypothetical protein K7I13_07310 [Brucepastera parasyntrophica]
MAAEKSLEIGKYGEKVIYRLLEYFGWTPIINNVDIECIRPELHNRKLKTHGIDYIKHYICPVQSDAQKTVVISAKYYEKYPFDPTKQLKEFLTDIGQWLFCIKPNAEYGRKKIKREIKDLQLRGLLFYLNHNEGFRDTIRNKIKQFRFSGNISFEPIYIIDNLRATFFYSIVEYFHRNYPGKELTYAYAETEYNLATFDNISYGNILPIEYMVSDIIPIRVDIDDERKILLVFSNNNYSDDSCTKIISFCKSFTKGGWNSKTIILYPDYRELKHGKKVSKILSTLSDVSYAKQISLESYPLLDFRKLEEGKDE